jgi:hypothetical protein
MHLVVDGAAGGCKWAERQTRAQLLRAIRRSGAEFSQADRMAVEAGDEGSVRTRFEGDMTAQTSGQRRRRSPAPSLRSGSAQTLAPQVWG